jgi:glucose/arabinose dehydrogenase
MFLLRAILLLALAVASLAVLYASDSSIGERHAADQPERFVTGFREETVIPGLELPTTFAFLADGRILIAEKGGVVRVVEEGRLLPQPLIDLSDRVNDYYERGLLGLAVDPQFESNGYVYLLYTYENDPDDFEGSKTGRLSRFTVVGNTANRDSEVVILGREVGRSCADLPAGSDCIPQDWNSHAVGDLEFASDGSLFVTIGDAAPWEFTDDRSFRSQDLDTIAGKVLRISRTGEGLPGNPFWTDDPDEPRSKVWAYGVRNAWRFGLDPRTDLPYLGDVGNGLMEEISVATAGANLGWPCFEGSAPSPDFGSDPRCADLMADRTARVAEPLVAWFRGGVTSAATGGAFYTGTAYPEEFRGAYFYGDWGRGFLRYLFADEAGRLIEGPVDFGPARTPADIEQGPDGNLYYVSTSPGALRRIVFEGEASRRDGS